MALDPKKRQRKLERKKAKDKDRKKKQLASTSQDSWQLMARLTPAPFLHCATSEVMFSQGISGVLVSRLLNDGRVAWVTFLVDAYCLGVKGVQHDVSSRRLFDEKVYRALILDNGEVELTPAAARKLIEGAVQYVRDLGFPPDSEYARAMLFFGDVDAADCDEEFTYGMNGKPLYIRGPSESEMQSLEIIHRLAEAVGQNGFNFCLAEPTRSMKFLGGQLDDEFGDEIDDEIDGEFVLEDWDDDAEGDEIVLDVAALVNAQFPPRRRLS